MDEQNAGNQEQSVVKIIQDINSGACDPLMLDKSTRQQCIEVLIGEGYSQSQLAQLFKRSEKTISRDMQDIRQKNSLAPSVEFAKEVVGELITKARQHAAYLMRLARDKDTPASTKAESEFLAWRVVKEATEKLQTLGYLPLKPQQVSGDIYHHVLNQEEDESYDQVKKMLSDIELAAKDTNTFTSELADEISRLKARIDKAEVSLKAKQLIKQQQEKQNKQEDKNGE